MEESSQHIASDLTSALLQSELCWTQCLNMETDVSTTSLEQQQQQQQQREAVLCMATDVRSRLQKAISASNHLFESNMHCTAIILKLKAEAAASR